jgi:competence protein ComEC
MTRVAAMPTAITAAVLLLVGVLLVQWLPTLPPRWCSGMLFPVALLLAWRCPRGRWLACLLLGIGWATWRGSMAMDARLPRVLEGRDFSIVGSLVDLPLAHTDASRFTLRVEQATLDGQPLDLRGRITVSWYDGAP